MKYLPLTSSILVFAAVAYVATQNGWATLGGFAWGALFVLAALSVLLAFAGETGVKK